MHANQAPIIARDLNHWFGEGEARKQALFDINLEIKAGSLTVLMGPSGSGKTTLLTLMACLRAVQSGNVTLLGQTLFGIKEGQQVAIRRKLGFIFQAHNLHESLSAVENVLMGLQVHGAGDRKKQRAAAIHVLNTLGLGERIDYLPMNLSGGQKQRVAIARAIVANPQVIFADEPTAALDKDSGRDAVEILKALGTQRNTTTLMVTHDNRILDLADRIITMEDGKIVSDTTAS
jgi:putative ABC transport system ATP-binding protein